MLIFLVDDDDIFNTIHEATISRLQAGSVIRVFKSGMEVMEAINNAGAGFMAPDLMFLDIRMPDMDGFVLLESLESMPDNPFKTTLIYMLSSTLDERDLVRANESALVKGFISKPMSSERFKEVINEISA